MISFTVPTVPVPQPRQRHRIATAANGKMFTQNYTPRKDPVNAFKVACQEALEKVFDGAPLDGPLFVSLLFVMPRPASMRNKKKPMEREFHWKRPDIDNLFKSFADSMRGRAWNDDAQVAWTTCKKVYASGIEAAHLEVRISRITKESPAPKE